MANKIATIFLNYKKSLAEIASDGLFYLIVLLIPFERAFKNEQVAFLQYFVVLFFCCSLFAAKKYYSRISCGIVFYVIFLFWGSISDIRTTGWLGFTSIWIMMRVWVVWFLMYASYNMSLLSLDKTKRLLTCLLCMAAMVALMRIIGIGVDESKVDRMEVMGANVNATARILILMIIYTLLIISRGIRVSKIVTILGCALSLISIYALIKTGSRGGTLALALAISGLVLTTKKISRKIIYLVLAGAALVGFILVVISNEALMERFFSAYYDDDTGGRKGFIEMSWEMLRHSKIFGYGCLAHTIELGHAFGIDVRATHNTYMYGLMAAGYPGAVFYYLALMVIAWKAWQIRTVPYGNFLFLVCFMMFFSGYVMNIEGTKWLYIVYGVTLGYADRIYYAKRLNLPFDGVCSLERMQ